MLSRLLHHLTAAPCVVRDVAIVLSFCSAWLLVSGAEAQTVRTPPRVGVLQNGFVATAGHMTEAFVRGLSDLGYVDGKNVVLEVRYAEGQFGRLPALAQELAELKVDVLFAPSALASNAARKIGMATPIVFALAPDPVEEGFVASLAHPGGNMTGLASLSPEAAAKRVELLRNAVPRMSRLAVLHARAFPGVTAQLSEAERATKLFGKEFLAVDVARPDDFESAFVKMTRWRADSLLVIENPMFFTNRNAVVALAEKYRLPAMYISREYVVSGGLMSYGSDYADLCRRAASYVDKILRGAKPGDLPVEQPIKFDLVINLRAAKAMGLTMPEQMLLRADRILD